MAIEWLNLNHYKNVDSTKDKKKLLLKWNKVYFTTVPMSRIHFLLPGSKLLAGVAQKITSPNAMG